MRPTRNILEDMADVISIEGLYRGDHFATRGNLVRYDLCALAFAMAEFRGPLTTPHEFFDDELASIRLIESSAGAMAAIRAISDALDTPVDEEELAPGFFTPNWIAHVSNWARTASPVDPKRPPTNAEVIDRILHAANAVAINTPTAPAA